MTCIMGHLQGRGRIKEAEKWLGSIGQLTNRLRDAAEASSATLDKNERTRRSIFTQGASVLVKRMHTLAEAEYLCCECATPHPSLLCRWPGLLPSSSNAKPAGKPCRCLCVCVQLRVGL